MLISSLLRAVRDFSEPALRRTVVWSILATATAFLVLVGLAWVLLFETRLIALSWLDTATDILGGLVALVLAYLLFPAVVVMVSGLLLDQVVEAVERRRYPHLPPPRAIGLAMSLGMSLRFFAIVAALNLLALPLYFVPGLNVLVFYALNGYLLSREYFELVTLRRMDREPALILRRRHGMRLFLAGVLIAFLTTVPVLNLLIPVLASAFMVHLVHGTMNLSAERLVR